jgi:hypothetical protein
MTSSPTAPAPSAAAIEAMYRYPIVRQAAEVLVEQGWAPGDIDYGLDAVTDERGFNGWVLWYLLDCTRAEVESWYADLTPPGVSEIRSSI